MIKRFLFLAIAVVFTLTTSEVKSQPIKEQTKKFVESVNFP